MASRKAADENLERFQCMFTWSRGVTYDIDSDWVIKAVEDKLLTSDCAWQSVVYHLVLFYEYQSLGRDPVARDHLVECEDIILDSQCFAPVPLIKSNLVSINHVLYSSWLHFIAKSHEFNDYKEYTSQVTLYKAMSKKEKAGVLALHAACLMQYGPRGNKAAGEFVQLAIRYDEHEGHWHYLQGEMLRYERLSNADLDVLPTEREKKCFELAHFYDEHTPSHYIALAASLYDSIKCEKGPCEIRDKATQLYKSALENWPNSAYVNLMCASGLLSYSYPVRDTRLGDKCLGKALSLAPLSSHVNLVAGAFFKWPSNNPVSANRHFNLAKKRFSTLVDKIRLEEISNYRMALYKAITDSPPPPPAPAPPVPDRRDDDDVDLFEPPFYLVL